MKSNEFRLGNLLIEKKYKIIVKVTDLLDNRIGVTGDFKGRWQVEPIPITEEWLLKFGFKTTISNKDSGYKQFRLRECKIDFMFSLECNGSPEFFLENVGLDIIYVHQLQNIYFALTGKELKL